MASMVSSLVGGLGLFLLGMILLTDGLRAAAGDSLRRLLAGFTGGPLKAMLSGAGITALVQSSSATTVATIGFVSAGLLTFPQAVGVVFGANLGTTATGWIVSLVGLKLQLSVLALPMVGIGVILRLTGRGASAPAGLAVAGFGLIFIGIDVLQAGMASLSGTLRPAMLPADDLPGRVLLVAVGAAMTVVLQSSSAAMATTLTALDAGTIHLHHGALLVIGQNLGTTVTAAIAVFGGSIPAKRTAVAHIAFNAVTALAAMLVLPVMLTVVDFLGADWGGPTALAAFHTGFNLLGIALLFPFVEGFAGLITRAIPERTRRLTRNLDPSVSAVPAVAVEAARRTLVEITVHVAEAARSAMGEWQRLPLEPPLELLEQAVVETQRFVASVRPPHDSKARARHLSLFHAIDHLDHLVHACGDPAARGVRTRPALVDARRLLDDALGQAVNWLNVGMDDDTVAGLGRLSGAMAERRTAHRRALLERTAFQQENVEAAATELAGMQWIQRVAYHTWRVLVHLDRVANGVAVGHNEVFDEPEPHSDSSEAATLRPSAS